MKILNNIKLFEGYRQDKKKTLAPEDIGTKGEVIVSWAEDGICGALLSKEEGDSLFRKMKERGYSEDVKMVDAENKAYLYYTGDSENIQAKGVELEPKTPGICWWVNSEADIRTGKHTENPNVNLYGLHSEDEDYMKEFDEEGYVMTLKRGCVTFMVAGIPGDNQDGILPVSEFFDEVLGEPYTPVTGGESISKSSDPISMEEFINKLEESGFSYEMEGKYNIIVTDYKHADSLDKLNDLISIPSGVEFKFRGSVKLNSLVSIDPTTKFNNSGSVLLNSVKSLPSGIEFNNYGGVSLGSLTSIDPSVKFNNKGSSANVYLDSIMSLPSGLEFNNKGVVKMESMNSFPVGVKFNNDGGVDFMNCSTRYSDVFNIRGISINRIIDFLGKRY